MQFEVNGVTYSNSKLSARQQLHVARRLASVLGYLAPAMMKDTAPEAVLPAFAKAIGQMSDEDMDYVIDACLATTQRQEKGGWQKVMVEGGALLYQDMDAGVLVQITANVVRDNLANFLRAPPLASAGPGPSVRT